MSRCRACDKLLTTAESSWDEATETHDDMCFKCRSKCYIEEEDDVTGLIDMYMGDDYDT